MRSRRAASCLLLEPLLAEAEARDDREFAAAARVLPAEEAAAELAAVPLPPANTWIRSDQCQGSHCLARGQRNETGQAQTVGPAGASRVRAGHEEGRVMKASGAAQAAAAASILHNNGGPAEGRQRGAQLHVGVAGRVAGGVGALAPTGLRRGA